MLSIHFSFGAHDPEDVPYLPRLILFHTRVYFDAEPGAECIYFREGATNAESDVRARRASFQAGEALFKQTVTLRLPDKRLRARLATTITELERTAALGAPPSYDLKTLQQHDQGLGGTLFSIAEQYFLERLRARRPFQLDSECYADRDVPSRVDAERRSRLLEIRAANEANEGNVEASVAAYAEMMQTIVANQDYRNAAILDRLRQYMALADQRGRSVRLVVRLGSRHRIIVQQARALLSDAATISHSLDEELTIALPTDSLFDDLMLGRRVPERGDYLTALFAGLVEGHLINRGVPRIERRRAMAAALAGVTTPELEAVLAGVPQGQLTPAIASFLERRRAGSQPAA